MRGERGAGVTATAQGGRRGDGPTHEESGVGVAHRERGRSGVGGDGGGLASGRTDVSERPGVERMGRWNLGTTTS